MTVTEVVALLKGALPLEPINAVDCPEDAEVLRIIFQSKWRLRMLREIEVAPKRLSELRRAIPDVTKKMLVDNLHFFTNLGWIRRQEFEGRVKHVEYSLAAEHTEKLTRLLALLD